MSVVYIIHRVIIEYKRSVQLFMMFNGLLWLPAALLWPITLWKSAALWIDKVAPSIISLRFPCAADWGTWPGWIFYDWRTFYPLVDDPPPPMDEDGLIEFVPCVLLFNIWVRMSLVYLRRLVISALLDSRAWFKGRVYRSAFLLT
jgi:hypothetical protein